MTVYLAGLISTHKPESLAWRKQAEAALREHGFEVLSPLRGKEALASESKDGGITTSGSTSRDIILRDYRDIVRSDAILMHLSAFGSERPLIGTMFELAWAWMLDKPVVAVVPEGDPQEYLLRNHPFVVQSVAHYCATVEEAVDFIVRYYHQ